METIKTFIQSTFNFLPKSTTKLNSDKAPVLDSEGLLLPNKAALDSIKIPSITHVIIGKSTTGKTSVFCALTEQKMGDLVQQYGETNYWAKVVACPTKSLQKCWDTAMHIAMSYLVHANVVILVFSLADAGSFDYLKERIGYIKNLAKKDCEFLLVGTHRDCKIQSGELEHQETGPAELSQKAEEFAIENGMMYIEFSTKVPEDAMLLRAKLQEVSDKYLATTKNPNMIREFMADVE